VRARDRRRVGEKRAGLQRGPERLDRLGDQLVWRNEPSTLPT
jgi:hypothetical protein